LIDRQQHPYVINTYQTHARLPWQVATACLLVWLAAVKPSLAQTPATNSSSEPEISVTPYLWTAGLGGDVGFRGQSGSIDASFGDILKNVKIGFTGAGDIRVGRVIVMSDVAYFRLRTPGTLPVPLDNVFDVEASTRQTTWTLNAGYRLVSTPSTSVDALAGFRLYDFSIDLDLLRPGTDAKATVGEADKTWVDPVVGMRIRQQLSPKVFVAGLFDVGGFGVSSDSTWQVFGGAGYQLRPALSLVGGYRYQSVDYDRGGALYDIANAGFLLGFGFRF
jgi:hypothetical protein